MCVFYLEAEVTADSTSLGKIFAVHQVVSAARTCDGKESGYIHKLKTL